MNINVVSSNFFNSFRKFAISIEKESQNIRAKAVKPIDQEHSKGSTVLVEIAQLAQELDVLTLQASELFDHSGHKPVLGDLIGLSNVLHASQSSRIKNLEAILTEYGYQSLPDTQECDKAEQEYNITEVVVVNENELSSPVAVNNEGDDMPENLTETIERPVELTPPPKHAVQDPIPICRTPSLQDFGISAFTLAALESYRSVPGPKALDCQHGSTTSISVPMDTGLLDINTWGIHSLPSLEHRLPLAPSTPDGTFLSPMQFRGMSSKPQPGNPYPAKKLPLISIEDKFAPVSTEQFTSLPQMCQRSMSLDVLNEAISQIKACVEYTDQQPSEVGFTVEQLRDELQFKGAAKAIVISLIKLKRIQASAQKNEHGETLYSFV